MEVLTANTLAATLGVHGMRITRAVRAHTITPDLTAGRTLLFYPSSIPKIRGALTPKTGP